MSVPRRGFTLLEVILALAILAGALLVLGELVRQGIGGAARARDMAAAQLIAESKLAELAAGITPLAASGATPAEQDPRWTVAVEVEPTVDTTILAVRVTVTPTGATGPGGTQVTLVRWLRDPIAAETSDATATDTASGETAP